jgi:hypothetical protein
MGSDRPPQEGTPSKIRTQGSGYCLGTLGSSDPGTEGLSRRDGVAARMGLPTIR